MALAPASMFQAPAPTNAPYTPEQAYGPMTQPGVGLFSAIRSMLPDMVNPAYSQAYQQYQEQQRALQAINAGRNATSAPGTVGAANPDPMPSGPPPHAALFAGTDGTGRDPVSTPAPTTSTSGFGAMMADLGNYEGAPVRAAPRAPMPDMRVMPGAYVDPNNPQAVLGMANAFHMNPAAAYSGMEAMERGRIASSDAVGNRYQQLVGAGYDPFTAARQARAEAMLANPATQAHYFDSGEADQDRLNLQQRLQQELYHAFQTGDATRLNTILSGMRSFAPYGTEHLTFATDAEGRPVQYVQEGGNVRRLEQGANGIPGAVGYFGTEGQTMQGDLQRRQQIQEAQNTAARQEYDALQKAAIPAAAQIVSRELPELSKYGKNGAITPQNASAAIGNATRALQVAQTMEDGPDKSFLMQSAFDIIRQGQAVLTHAPAAQVAPR